MMHGPVLLEGNLTNRAGHGKMCVRSRTTGTTGTIEMAKISTTIHHATVKRAEASGIILSMIKGHVVAVCHQYGVKVEGTAGEPAGSVLDRAISSKEERQRAEYLNEQEARAKEFADNPVPNENWPAPVDEDPSFEHMPDHDTPEYSEEGDLEDQLEAALDHAFGEALVDGAIVGGVLVDGDDVPRINGISTDGRVAYEEGTLTADCPFNPESDDAEEAAKAEAWYWNWDAAADEAAEADDEEKGGSVVSSHFRAKYAEAGHPTHCGDWLATTLIGYTTNDAGINVDLFEEICKLNSVDLTKYKREGNGWQGRLRMTGRNILAKNIYRAGGVLHLPNDLTSQAPEEWMSSQRYKMPKSEQ